MEQPRKACGNLRAHLPRVEALFAWLEEQLPRPPRGASKAEKIRHALDHRAGLERLLDDGRLDMDPSVVERAIRSSCLSPRHALFPSGGDGGEGWACTAALMETCKLTGLDPQRYFTEIMKRPVNGRMESRIDALMPWNGASTKMAEPQAVRKLSREGSRNSALSQQKHSKSGWQFPSQLSLMSCP
ncbi:transposase domain-containing protein [Sediminicoccus sp. BL-A-41-H5]|uniref:transposase domain-containing protein n=1 Tax=Sediminicoccus sp. BL-A-41-H5 TaxID=3421106 RepID=UPI003D66E8EC